MIHLTRTEDEIEALRYEHFHHPHPRVQMTMAAVPLTALGLSRSVVARVAGCSETTVRTYLKAYQGGGIEALKHFSVGGSTSDLEAHRNSLREEFAQRPPRSVHEARHRIHQLTGLQRSPSQVRAYLQRLGFKCRKGAPHSRQGQSGKVSDGSTRASAQRSQSGPTPCAVRGCRAFCDGRLFGVLVVSGPDVYSHAIGPPTF